jgi:hypothetical protein
MEIITFDECITTRTAAGAYLMRSCSGDNLKEAFNISFEKRQFEVELKVNGFEVSFRDIIADMFNAYKTDVSTEAFRLVQEKLNNLERMTHSIEKVLGDARREVVSICSKELPDADISEDDYY